MTAILAIVSTGCGSQKQNVEPTVSGGTYQGSGQNRLASMAKYGDWRTLVTSGKVTLKEHVVDNAAQDGARQVDIDIDATTAGHRGCQDTHRRQ